MLFGRLVEISGGLPPFPDPRHARTHGCSEPVFRCGDGLLRRGVGRNTWFAENRSNRIPIAFFGLGRFVQCRQQSVRESVRHDPISNAAIGEPSTDRTQVHRHYEASLPIIGAASSDVRSSILGTKLAIRKALCGITTASSSTFLSNPLT